MLALIADLHFLGKINFLDVVTFLGGVIYLGRVIFLGRFTFLGGADSVNKKKNIQKSYIKKVFLMNSNKYFE